MPKKEIDADNIGLIDLVNQGEILVATSVLNFIDTDRCDRMQISLDDPIGNNLANCSINAVPIRSKDPGYFLPTQTLFPSC